MVAVNNWRATNRYTDDISIRQVVVDLDRQVLSAWDDEQLFLQIPCSTDPAARAGKYYVSEKKPGGLYRDADQSFYGVPWLTRLGEEFVSGGVYWHNQFGKAVPGMTLQVPPFAAKLFYDGLNDRSEIILLS